MRRPSPNRRTLSTTLLVPAVVVAVLSLTLAACGGSGSGGSTAMTQASSGQGAVSVAQIGESGRVLVDSSGQALYASNLEGGGKVLCTEACNSFWKPVEGAPPAKSASLPGEIGTINRPDGGRQLTYNGMPLYSFTQEGPEEVTGNGFVDDFNGHKFTWSVVSVEGGSGEAAGSGSQAASSSAGGYSY